MRSVNIDRFGNPYQLVGMKDKKGNGFPYGYVELNGKLYKVEVHNSNKSEVSNWVKITLCKKRPNVTM